MNTIVKLYILSRKSADIVGYYSLGGFSRFCTPFIHLSDVLFSYIFHHSLGYIGQLSPNLAVREYSKHKVSADFLEIMYPSFPDFV